MKVQTKEMNAEEQWESMLSFVLRYRELTGKLPAGTAKLCFAPDGRDVGLWLTRQRRLYAGGTLPEARSRLLLEAGILRQGVGLEGNRRRARERYAPRKKNDHWDECYAAAKAWYSS